MAFITSGPLVAMVLEGEQAVEAARQVIGATNPLQAATGSIRGDYAIATGRNLVHGSDSDESAAREVGLFFSELDASGEPRPPVDAAAADPRIALAAAARDSRAARDYVRAPGARSGRAEVGAARRDGARERLSQGGRPWPSSRSGGLVLGVDTVVAVGGLTYGKPADADAHAGRR